MNPWAGRHWSELSADELKQRRQWMVDEANRLIDARAKVQRPVNAVAFPEVADDSGAAYRDQIGGAAGKIIAALNRRDAGSQR